MSQPPTCANPGELGDLANQAVEVEINPCD
jgi:hypothetical protein